MTTEPPSPFSERERELLLASMMEHNRLSREDAEKLLDGNPQGRRNVYLERQWVQNLNHACRVLCAGEGDGFAETAFWIKLYGAVTELLERFSRSADVHPNAPPETLVYRFSAGQRGVFEACTAVRDSLSEEELVCLTMLRHTHAHVYQHGFELQVRRGNAEKSQPGGVKTNTMVPLIGRHIDVERAHQILDEMCRIHGTEGDELAVDFARKVSPAVQKLEEAMDVVAALRAEDEEETRLLIERRNASPAK